MKVKFEETNETTIAFIEGEINTNTTKDLEAALNEKVSMGTNLILDFAGVTMIASSGLRLLMQLQKELESLGSMTIRNVNSNVYEVFKMVRLDTIFTIEGSESNGALDAAATDDVEINSSFELEEYYLTEDDFNKLPGDIQMLHDREEFFAYSINDEDEQLGFAVYDLAKNQISADLIYIYINEASRGKGAATALVKKMMAALADKNIKELYLCFPQGVDGQVLADKLNFKQTDRTQFLMTYTKKQIMASPLWKQIDKLRTMFDKVKIFDQLDLMEKLQLEQLADAEADTIDKLYTRIFISEGVVLGMLSAKEIAENNLLITKIMVRPSKDARFAQPLMLASLLDAVCVLLEDENLIKIINNEEALAKSYEQVLGMPAETSVYTYYKAKIS